MTYSVSDLLHAGSDRLRPTLPPAGTVRRTAERRRRNRRIGAVVTPAVLAALVMWLDAAGQLRNSTAPPPTTPGPHLIQSLAADPLLTKVEGVPIRASAADAGRPACLSDPVTWGAAEVDAATYRRRGAPPFAQESVLRFNSVAAAHHAVIGAWRQFRRCPAPPNVSTDPIRRPGPSTTIYELSELFANQLARFATPHSINPISMYSLRVGRWRNIVVVVETTSSDDRADYVLWLAMSKATGRAP